MAKILVIAEHLDGKLNSAVAKTVSAATAVGGDIDVLVLAAAAALLEAFNLVRILALVLAVKLGGRDVFVGIHDSVGSAIMLVAFTITLVVFFKLGFFARKDVQRGRRRVGRGPSAPTRPAPEGEQP